MNNKKMMSTLQQTMKHQRLQLESMTKRGEDDNDDDINNDVVSSKRGMSEIDDRL